MEQMPRLDWQYVLCFPSGFGVCPGVGPAAAMEDGLEAASK